MFRPVKNLAKKNFRPYTNSTAELSPSFAVRKSSEKTEITVWPNTVYYPDIKDVSLGDISLYVIIEDGSLKFWIPQQEIYIERMETYLDYYNKFVNCIYNSEIYWSENQEKFLIDALKKDGFDEIQFMYAGYKSRKHHAGLTRYFVKDANTDEMKHHIWAKDKNHLLEILKQKYIDLSDVDYYINMTES